VHVFNLVVVEVALVDAVQALNVGVALLLKGRPVEGRRLLDVEPVGLALVYGLGQGGRVEGDLFRYAAIFQKNDTWSAQASTTQFCIIR